MKDDALTKTFTIRKILRASLPVVIGIAAGMYATSGVLDVTSATETLATPRLIASQPLVFPENEEMLDRMGDSLRAEMDFVTPFDPSAIEPAGGEELTVDPPSP